MNTLISSFAAKSIQTLYHAIPGKPRGDAIEASANYGAIIPQALRKKLGMRGDEKTPLVFAATRLCKALAFAIPKGIGKLFNTSIEAADTEIAVACDREKFMSYPLDATIFSFSDNGFVRLPYQHQSASIHPVPFNKTKQALKASSMEDLMRAGLQIFTFEGTYQTLDPAVDKLSHYKDDAKLMAALGELIKSGKGVWENQSRGLNPNSRLAGMMGIKLPCQPRRQPGL